MRYQRGPSRRLIRADDDWDCSAQTTTRVPEVEEDMVGRARPTGVLGPDGQELYHAAPPVGFVIASEEEE